MADRPKILDHMGPYCSHEPVAVFCSISERCWTTFHEAIGGQDRRGETPREHLITRMMYVAESTSTAIRLNTSWGLSLPGMSLVRERYEHVVRFSWLARQQDDGELIKYIASYYAKANKVLRGSSPKILSEMDGMGFSLEPWMTEAPTKEQRKYLEQWWELDLSSMAKKRDALPCSLKGALGREPLSDLYVPVYQQFSSVTHNDMYGLNMLSFHRAPNGEMVLAPDPWWPALLCIHNALFDLIQCGEAATAFYRKASGDAFEALFLEWREFMDRVALEAPSER